jgi:tripartite-type tricarboxylate transporter receptor subunit TctC
MRALLSLLLVVAAWPALPQAAESYAARPVRLVVPFPPGGPADIIARTVGARLGAALKQAVVIDNRGGGNGNIGAELVARAPADGYTLLLMPSALAANRSLYARLSYDLDKDLTGVAGLAVFPLVLVVHPSAKVTTVPGLIALARQKPGTLNYASAGSGGGAHLAAETFRRAAGIEVVHVPYKGTGPAVAGILGGQVTFMFASIPSVIGHVRAGKLNALALSSSRRADALPALPTISEAGLPGYELTSWFGIAAPAGTSPEIIKRLNAELTRIVSRAEFLERLKSEGGVPMAMEPAAFHAFITSEIARWARIVKETGAKLE